MVGRPKTRLKRFREVNKDLEFVLEQLIITAPRRASADKPPTDRVGLLWRKAIDVVTDAFLTNNAVIELLGEGQNVAGDGDGSKVESLPVSPACAREGNSTMNSSAAVIRLD